LIDSYKFFKEVKVEKLKILKEKPFQLASNLYYDEEICLSPHKDSIGKQALLISFNSTIIVDFYYHPTNKYCIFLYPESDYESAYGVPTTSLFLQPGSIFSFTGEAFTDYLHGIQLKKEDIIDEKICNKDLIGDIETGTKFKRGTRIVVVIWC